VIEDAARAKTQYSSFYQVPAGKGCCQAAVPVKNRAETTRLKGHVISALNKQLE
jgi:hypothetical protein